VLRWAVVAAVLVVVSLGCAQEIPAPHPAKGDAAVDDGPGAALDVAAELASEPEVAGAAEQGGADAAVDELVSPADGAPGMDAGGDGRPDADAASDGNTSPSPDAADARDAAPEAVDAKVVYAPCPAAGACAVLPLGDSITDGVGSTGGGYRPPLFHLALAAKKALTFVGTGMNGPTTVDGVTFPRRHEGHSGYTIDHGGPANRSGLSTDIDLVNVIKSQKPNIVTLMIGTNDVDTNFDLPNAPTRLGKLMDMILDADPKLLLVVAQMVPTGNDAQNVKVRAYNAAIPGLVMTRASAGRHVISVDMYAAFTANAAYKTALMSDDLHPKDAGYAVMATTWYAALGPLLR
jgi:lysophospholipase L1-like esterase